MKQMSEYLQPNLFDDARPAVVLRREQVVELATLLTSLFAEIAAAQANRGIGDDKDRG